MIPDNTLSLTFENQVFNFDRVNLSCEVECPHAFLGNNFFRYGRQSANEIAQECSEKFKKSVQTIQEATTLNLYISDDSHIINRVKYYALSAVVCHHTHNNQFSVSFHANRYGYSGLGLTSSAYKKLKTSITGQLIDYYIANINSIRAREITAYKTEFLNLLVQESEKMKASLARISLECNTTLEEVSRQMNF